MVLSFVDRTRNGVFTVVWSLPAVSEKDLGLNRTRARTKSEDILQCIPFSIPVIDFAYVEIVLLQYLERTSSSNTYNIYALYLAAIGGCLQYMEYILKILWRYLQYILATWDIICSVIFVIISTPFIMYYHLNCILFRNNLATILQNLRYRWSRPGLKFLNAGRVPR